MPPASKQFRGYLFRFASLTSSRPPLYGLLLSVESHRQGSVSSFFHFSDKMNAPRPEWTCGTKRGFPRRCFTTGPLHGKPGSALLGPEMNPEGNLAFALTSAEFGRSLLCHLRDELSGQTFPSFLLSPTFSEPRPSLGFSFSFLAPQTAPRAPGRATSLGQAGSGWLWHPQGACPQGGSKAPNPACASRLTLNPNRSHSKEQNLQINQVI